MKCLVTGAGGFIGSHLCEELLGLGHEVIGIDALIPYYPAEFKKRNLASSLTHSRFEFLPLDLRKDSLDDAVAETEVVFHLAAMPGLVKSWTDFDDYWTCNVQATERLLNAVRAKAQRLERFLYISTSSVYGKFSAGDES